MAISEKSLKIVVCLSLLGNDQTQCRRDACLCNRIKPCAFRESWLLTSPTSSIQTESAKEAKLLSRAAPPLRFAVVDCLSVLIFTGEIKQKMPEAEP